MVVLFCGMSGAGKSTLAQLVKSRLSKQNIAVEVLDADDYRKNIIKELGFSKADRGENIRRLAFVANKFSQHHIVAIVCAINPYEEVRQEMKEKYPHSKTIFITCNIKELIKRDTKGLYQKAYLPDTHPEKIHNLTGVNDPFEPPTYPDLEIHSDAETAEESAKKVSDFIQIHYATNLRKTQ
ncbi:MAG: adenylyl-sulfate kinase [Bacteroidetes bacterium]|nr:adenylyl-sulfate kinase [Bacteroidota bacterium]